MENAHRKRNKLSERTDKLIEIFPVKSKPEQERMCLRCDIEYENKSSVYIASENDSILGLCKFKINDNTASITAISSEIKPIRNDIAILLCSSVINFLISCKVEKILFEAEGFKDTFIHSLGFKKTDDNWTLE